MSSFQVVVQRPVMQEQRLGSIPKDVYVQNRPFQPNIPPPVERVPGDLFEVRDGQEIRGMVPARAADGSLQVVSEPVTLTAEPHSPVKLGLLGGVAGGAAGAAVGAAMGGLAGAVAGGLAAALAGGALGALTARADEVSVVTREAQVTQPVLTGYTAGSIDGIYVPGRRGPWWTDSGGRFHYYLPQIEHRPVGTVQVHEIAHSAPGGLEVVGAALALGLGSGALATLGLAALTLL
jgi:outer membrane lipoprotein SlyB